jgi:hypothetical protein
MSRKLYLALLPGLAAALIACPSADDDDTAVDDAGGAGWYALVSHAAFGGDATLASIDLSDLTVDDDLLGLSGSDWGLTVADGSPWLIGRFFVDTLRRYDGLDFSAPTLEFSVGAGTNPHDMAVCGERIFVTRYDATEDGTGGGDLAMFDLATGGPLGTVDLSGFNPHKDGTPEPDRMVQVGDTLYVALQRFDRDDNWVADPVGKLVEVDCTNGTVGSSWDIGRNPWIRSVPGEPTKIEIRHAGGIDVFDTDGATTTQVVVDSALGAEYVSVGIGFSGTNAILVAEVDWSTNEIWCLNLAAGTSTMLASVPQRNWAVTTAPDGNVWVLWRDHWATDSEVEAGGIAIYDPATCTELGEEWIDFDADPADLVFYKQGE